MTNNINILATQSLSVKRTAKGMRIWLEGKRPALAGFNRYAGYNRTITDDSVILTLSNTGSHNVAGRTRNGKDLPIIDIMQQQIGAFNADDKLKAVYSNGMITVTKE